MPATKHDGRGEKSRCRAPPTEGRLDHGAGGVGVGEAAWSRPCCCRSTSRSRHPWRCCRCRGHRSRCGLLYRGELYVGGESPGTRLPLPLMSSDCTLPAVGSYGSSVVPCIAGVAGAVGDGADWSGWRSRRSRPGATRCRHRPGRRHRCCCRLVGGEPPENRSCRRGSEAGRLAWKRKSLNNGGGGKMAFWSWGSDAGSIDDNGGRAVGKKNYGEFP